MLWKNTNLPIVPLVHMFHKSDNKKHTSQCRNRHIAFIAEYITDVQHISGNLNIVADVLSHVETDKITEDGEVIMENLACIQYSDDEIKDMIVNYYFD